MSQNQMERPVVTEENKTRIRAGITGQGVRAVLFSSLAIVIVAFIAIAIWVR